MKLRRAFYWMLVLLVLLLGAAGVGVCLVLQTPDVYQQQVDIPPQVQKVHLEKLEEKKEVLLKEIEEKPDWSFQLSEQEANSWLASVEFQENIGDDLLPEIRNPRVQFLKEQLSIAFQLTYADWSGVVTITLELVSLTPEEMKFKIAAIKTGVLPFSWQEVLASLLEEARDELPEGFHWEVSETEETIFTVQLSMLPTFPLKLEKLDLTEGLLNVSGRHTPSNISSPPKNVLD